VTEVGGSVVRSLSAIDSHQQRRSGIYLLILKQQLASHLKIALLESVIESDKYCIAFAAATRPRTRIANGSHIGMLRLTRRNLHGSSRGAMASIEVGQALFIDVFCELNRIGYCSSSRPNLRTWLILKRLRWNYTSFHNGIALVSRV
jgi:hypothetical protein